MGRSPNDGGERRFHPCRFQLRGSQQEPPLGEIMPNVAPALQQRNSKPSSALKCLLWWIVFTNKQQRCMLHVTESFLVHLPIPNDIPSLKAQLPLSSEVRRSQPFQTLKVFQLKHQLNCLWHARVTKSKLVAGVWQGRKLMLLMLSNSREGHVVFRSLLSIFGCVWKCLKTISIDA